MVSVVYVVSTPACEAGSMGSTPIGHPSKIGNGIGIGVNNEHKRIATSDASAQPQLAASERSHGGPCACVVVERSGARRRRGRLPDVLVERLVEAQPAR